MRTRAIRANPKALLDAMDEANLPVGTRELIRSALESGAGLERGTGNRKDFRTALAFLTKEAARMKLRDEANARKRAHRRPGMYQRMRPRAHGFAPSKAWIQMRRNNPGMHWADVKAGLDSSQDRC